MSRFFSSVCRALLGGIFAFAYAFDALAQNCDEIPGVPCAVYKQADTLELKLWIVSPEQVDPGKQYPAIVFFFGGGWHSGSVRQFQKQARYLASRGMVAVLADYRVRSRHGTTPFESVADAKSAIRYLRQHADHFQIDPNRLAGAGGSAGAHIAAAADLTLLDEPAEDHAVSSRPNALVLFNPVFNNGPGEFGHALFGDRYREISPYHTIKAGAAPTLVMLGTEDKLVPVATAQAYAEKMKEAGNVCELILYQEQGHGFFNRDPWLANTLADTDRFLQSIGYLPKKEDLDVERFIRD